MPLRGVCLVYPRLRCVMAEAALVRRSVGICSYRRVLSVSLPARRNTIIIKIVAHDRDRLASASFCGRRLDLQALLHVRVES